MLERGPFRFGPFVLVRPLGRGGMGEVWLARSTRIDHPIAAVKRLRGDVARVPTFAERFKHEADLSVRLKHRAVVATIEAGSVEDQLYVASELVLGKDTAIIADRLRERGQGAPLAVVIRILLDVLSGLAYVHSARDTDGRWLNLVHRDVTPGNVLLSYDGSAKLADFGLAKSVLTQGSHLTGHGEIIGTPHYLAPEVIRGEKAEKTADVYGLGAVTYRILTGVAPFQGTTAEVLFKALSEKPRPIGEWRPDLPPWFVTFLHELLEADPRRRPFDAGLLVRRLEHEATEAKLLLPPESVGRWLRQLFDEERTKEVEEHEAIAALDPDSFPGATEGTVVLAHFREGAALEGAPDIPSGSDLENVGTELDLGGEAVAMSDELRRARDQARARRVVPREMSAGDVGDIAQEPTMFGPVGPDSGELPPMHFPQSGPGLEADRTKRNNDGDTESDPRGIDLGEATREAQDEETGEDDRARLPGFAEQPIEGRPPIGSHVRRDADVATAVTDLEIANRRRDDPAPVVRPKNADSVLVAPVGPPLTRPSQSPPPPPAPIARPPEERFSPRPPRAAEPPRRADPSSVPPTPLAPAPQIGDPGRSRLAQIVTIALSAMLAIGVGVAIGLWLSSVRDPVRVSPEREQLVARFSALKAELSERTAKNEPIPQQVLELFSDAAAALIAGDLPKARAAIEELERRFQQPRARAAASPEKAAGP